MPIETDIIQSRIAVPGVSGGTTIGDFTGGLARITALEARVFAILASSVSTTSITPSSITGFSFAIGASEKWMVDIVFGTGCSGAGGIKFQSTVPAGCSIQLTGLGSGSAQNNLIINNTASGLTPAFNTGTFYNGVVRFTCAFRNGGTAGTVQFQSAAGTAGQTATVYTDSSMRAQKVA